MPARMQLIGQNFPDPNTFQSASNWSRLRPPLFIGFAAERMMEMEVQTVVLAAPGMRRGLPTMIGT